MQMNTHPVMEEDLMAYLDGELPPGAATEVAQHLEGCEVCQALAADFQSVSRRLYGWGVDANDLEMSRKLREELDSKRKSQKRLGRGLFSWLPTNRHASFVFLAGFVLMLVGLLITLGMPRSSEDADQRSEHMFLRMVDRVPNPKEDNKISIMPSGNVSGLGSDPAQAWGPLLIVRTADLSLTTRDFGNARRRIENTLRSYQGYIAQLDINTQAGQARSLNATLRIPFPKLDAALAELRELGHVEAESQRGVEVTQRNIDITARLENARNTEQRLIEILRHQTGKIPEILAVEEKLNTVRAEVETLSAEKKLLSNQVELATVQLTVAEEFRKPLSVERTGTLNKIRNSAVKGIQTAVDGTIGLVAWLLSAGPSLLLIAALLLFPARWFWRKRNQG